MRVTKLRKASRSYGRGSDNHRIPAVYAVINAAGVKVGVILGSRAGYMERSSWEVCWLEEGTVPRLVKCASSFKAAKAWAEAWDGQPLPKVTAVQS